MPASCLFSSCLNSIIIPVLIDHFNSMDTCFKGKKQQRVNSDINMCSHCFVIIYVTNTCLFSVLLFQSYYLLSIFLKDEILFCYILTSVLQIKIISIFVSVRESKLYFIKNNDIHVYQNTADYVYTVCSTICSLQNICAL